MANAKGILLPGSGRRRMGIGAIDDTRLDRLLRLVLLGVIIGVPLVVLGSFTYDPFNVPKLALLFGGVALATGLVGIRWLQGHGPEGAGLLAIPSIALVAPLFLSWLISPHKGWALLGSYARYTGLLPYVAFALLGLLSVHAFRNRADVLAWVMAINGGLIGSYVFIQALGIDPLWSPGEAGTGDYPPSTIGHFNFVGGFLAISLPLSIYLWARAGTKGPRIAAIWATVATTIGLLLANSQGGWVAGLAGLAIIAGSLLASRWPRARLIGMAAAASIAVLVVGAVVASLLARDVGALGGTIRSRGLLWVTALEMGADSPLLGHGPGAYSLEGIGHRGLDSVLAERNTTADEPHSVPLGFWANAGALGAVGFAVLSSWIILAGTRISPGDHRSTAFFAAAIAYLVQSTVSIDDLSLRAVLWTALAGMVISIDRPSDGSEENLAPADAASGRASPSLVVSIAAAGLLAASVLWYSGGLIVADHRVRRGIDSFEAGNVDSGRAYFQQATAFRFEPHYLGLFADEIAIAALNQGERGAALIDEMRDIYSYLDTFPDTRGLLAQARNLHYWAYFEPSANLEALAVLRRARSHDPENPEIDIRISEVLVDIGDAERGRELLETWVPSLRGTFPEFWGALATARLMTDDVVAAEAALAEGTRLRSSDCRVRIAQALLHRLQHPQREPDPDDAFTFQLNCGLGEFRYLSGLATRVGRSSM